MVVGFGGQGGCERRIEVFLKIQKKCCCFLCEISGWGGGGGGWGVRMGRGFGRESGQVGGRVGVRWGSGWIWTKNGNIRENTKKKDFEGGVGIGSGRVGVRVDVNQELKFL